MLKRLSIILLMLVIIPSTALAVDIQNDQSATVILSDEVVKGPGFYSGDTVKIDGTIDGALFVAAREVIINGTIKGDVFSASRKIIVNGTVEGDLHSASQKIDINGNVLDDARVAAERISVGKNAVINRDAMMVASELVHMGQIQRQLFAGAENIGILGSVNDDVRLEVGRLKVTDTATIKGDLNYHSPNKATIDNTAQITGNSNWQKTEPKKEVQESPFDGFSSILLSIISALLLWLVITFWRPGFWTKTASPLMDHSLKALGAGFLALILVPLIAVVSMITIVGAPIGVILGLTYGVSIYIAKIVAASVIGLFLANKYDWAKKHKGTWAVLLGLVVISAIGYIPVAGFIFKLFVIVAGLGSLVMAHWRPTPK
ncbi:MAG: polymer-forming cytoskeletal protein [Firmicutes bacterium]|nr:polymer-forming cytoskeletal protein [Bacillota bacterium]